LGLVATTSSGGAGNWREEFASYFFRKDVVVLPDNDPAGRKYAEKVAANVFPVARAAKVVALPGLEEKQDVSDFCAKAGAEAKKLLLACVEDAPAWMPAAAPAAASKVVLGETSEHLTDLGNARRLVGLHGKDLRYCHALGKWLVWDGTRWNPDADEEVTRRMVEVIHQMHGLAGCQANKQAREALERWAKQSESDGKIRAAISLAESQRELVIAPDQLDQHPWLLNCENGTLDLRTSELCAHRREDYLTQKAGAAYDPTAECPTWFVFLRKIMDGSEEMVGFLKRAVGYTLTGQITEQCLFILWGRGQNGKTTFLNAIRDVTGDYQYHAPFSTFLYERHHSIRNDLAALRGKRYVTAIEADPGERLSESVIKTVTGGDPMTVRFLHHEFFSYYPHYKLWLGVNDKPVVRGTSKGTWRRIRLIPFTVVIPDSEIDGSLGEKLRGELPGILSWAVKGCEQWRQGKLAPPPEVLNATGQYREEMDLLGGFISDSCLIGAGAQVKAGELYTAYKSYCERTGERALCQRDFGLGVEQRGYEKDKGTHGVRLWKGLTLKGSEGPTGVI
jgi:putative DNA primase/helicase